LEESYQYLNVLGISTP